LKYIERVKTPEQFSEPLVVGSYAHTVLEDVLAEGINPKDSFKTHLSEWLTSLALEFDPDDVYELAEGIGILFYKATARYSGSDAIRNSNGSVPADVTKYPPGNWTKALKQSGLDSKKFGFDGLAAWQNAVFERLSFSFLVGEIFSFVAPFKVPAWIEETLAVELPISTDEDNKILFPGHKELAFNAYIDWIFRRTDSLKVICDHKTGSKKPEPVDVLHNVQLNLYAYLYHCLYGEWTDAIAIHHVPSGDIIMVEVDKTINQQVIQYISMIQRQIESGVYTKRQPGEFNSPCLKRDFKTGEVTEVCPYLHLCWPDFLEMIGASSTLM
jgi:hypothetical protein